MAKFLVVASVLSAGIAGILFNVKLPSEVQVYSPYGEISASVLAGLLLALTFRLLLGKRFRIRRPKRYAKLYEKNAQADLDTQRYRQGYPGKVEEKFSDANLRFFMGQTRLPGSSYTIDEILKEWFGDYKRLQNTPHYIQWLFPIREPSGYNAVAEELQLHEAEAIRKQPQCMERLQKSYELMLDFFGLKLINPKTGAVARSDHYKERYENLAEKSNNSLRISRILKCLGELGLEHYKKQFILYILQEIYEHDELASLEESCQKYWVGLLRSDAERAQVQKYIESNLP